MRREAVRFDDSADVCSTNDEQQWPQNWSLGYTVFNGFSSSRFTIAVDMLWPLSGKRRTSHIKTNQNHRIALDVLTVCHGLSSRKLQTGQVARVARYLRSPVPELCPKRLRRMQTPLNDVDDTRIDCVASNCFHQNNRQAVNRPLLREVLKLQTNSKWGGSCLHWSYPA